jgi:predicted DsbA family dithiol-disulfide isomerase
MFADFQCPYCKRAQAVIDEVVAKYPGKVRIVWRHLPLPTHEFAQMAAEASVEAFRQKGDTGFWAFAARLWEAQSAPQGFDRVAIERAAGEAGLDVAKLSAAIDARTHWKSVVADAELAERLKITGTPGFVINDYFVSGAQPFAAFKRRIDEALGARKPIEKDALIADAHVPVPLGATAPPALFTPPPSLPQAAPTAGQLGAKHIIVMYAGSMRVPVQVTRSRAEALVRAEEVRKRLAAGARFEDMAAVYSDEPDAARRGGDLGFFPRGAMVPQFQTALESLTVGQVSGIVETPFGFHIILRTR